MTVNPPHKPVVIFGCCTQPSELSVYSCTNKQNVIPVSGGGVWYATIETITITTEDPSPSLYSPTNSLLSIQSTTWGNRVEKLLQTTSAMVYCTSTWVPGRIDQSEFPSCDVSKKAREVKISTAMPLAGHKIL